MYNNLWISSFEFTLYYCAPFQILAAPLFKFELHDCDHIVLHRLITNENNSSEFIMSYIWSCFLQGSLDHFHSGFGMNIIDN